jgi:hypothetical protein
MEVERDPDKQTHPQRADEGQHAEEAKMAKVRSAWGRLKFGPGEGLKKQTRLDVGRDSRETLFGGQRG